MLFNLCMMHPYTMEKEDKEMEGGLDMDMKVLVIWRGSHCLRA